MNRLGSAGIYVLIDAHQDVLSRWTCGEGMPAFYAKQILDKDVHCISKAMDPFLLPTLQQMGMCHPMSSYGHQKDEKGLPLLEDCSKTRSADY